MSRRDLAAVLFAVWTVASAGGVARVLRLILKGNADGTGLVLAGGVSLLCGAYAATGWAWFLATGPLR